MARHVTAKSYVRILTIIRPYPEHLPNSTVIPTPISSLSRAQRGLPAGRDLLSNAYTIQEILRYAQNDVTII